MSLYNVYMMFSYPTPFSMYIPVLVQCDTVNAEIIATVIFNDFSNPGTLTSLNDNVFKCSFYNNNLIKTEY